MTAYLYPLLIKQLLLTPLATRRNRRSSIATSTVTITGCCGIASAVWQRTESAAGADGRGDGLGQPPLSGMFLRDPDAGRGVADGERAPVAGTDRLYLNHARADVLFVHEDFLPLLESFRARLETVQRFVLLSDAVSPDCPPQFETDYETLLEGATRS